MFQTYVLAAGLIALAVTMFVRKRFSRGVAGSPKPSVAIREAPPNAKVRFQTRWIMRVLSAAVITLLLLAHGHTKGKQGQSFDPSSLAVVVFDECAEYILQRSDWWPDRWIAFVLPTLILPSLAWLFHQMDLEQHGGGIRDRVASLPHPHSSLDPAVISATMTKQSILAAIAAIFLARGRHGNISSVAFDEFSAALSLIGFAFALLLLTVSALSYDYANRFKFTEEEKYALVRKGMKFDVASWYILIASYIVSIASTDPRTSILLSIATGLVVREYYFVKSRAFGPPRQRFGSGDVLRKARQAFQKLRQQRISRRPPNSR